MPSVYVVGWVSQAVRIELLAQPQAPSNYKDPAKIREYEEAALARMMAEASAVPVIASLCHLRVEDLKHPGVTVLQESSNFPGAVAASLLRWLNDPSTEISMLYGFDAEILFEMAALEILASQHVESLRMSLPYQLWHETGFIKDPYKMLCRSDTRKMVSLPNLVKFLLKQDFNPQAFTNPQEQIRLARAIVEVGQLPGR